MTAFLDGFLTRPRSIVAAAAAVVAMVVTAGPAGADPTPTTRTGIPDPRTGGPQFPGAQVYPPRCLEAMRSCGFEYSPDDGTWHAPPPSE